MFDHEGSEKKFWLLLWMIPKQNFIFQKLWNSELMFPPKSPEILTDLLNNYNPFLLISWEIVRKS